MRRLAELRPSVLAALARNFDLVARPERGRCVHSPAAQVSR
ncbi:MAG TPA: hypothetical protein VMB85_00490 [Bryobacteraceae bacterium]|nr:hypothetical protein [Bryobacteraceae bacterium]